MEYLSLANNVYIVDGKAKSCIYDLKSGNLYSISHEAKDLLCAAIARKNPLENIASDHADVLHYFIEQKILAWSDVAKNPDKITDLAKETKTSFVWLEVTRRCNLSCSFCYESSSPVCTETMSYEDFVFTADKLKEINVKRIQFIGGEPLLLKDTLKKMIIYARDFFNFIEVYTNAKLLNQEWCDFFKKHKIHVALSIHSYIPEEHDKTVNKVGAHKKVIQAVKLLKDNQMPHRIACIKTSSCNIGKPDDATNFKLSPSLPKVCGKTDLSQFDFEMFQKKAITKESKRHPIKKNMVMAQLVGHKCFLKDLYIKTNLDVYPCVMERRVTYGNLKDLNLEDMLKNEVRFYSKDKIKTCKDCEYRYTCFDCRPDANGGNIDDKPWYCTYDPYSGEWMDINKKWELLQQS